MLSSLSESESEESFYQNFILVNMKPVKASTGAIDRFDVFTIVLDVLLSIVGGLVVHRLIPILKEKFIKAQLWGYDLNKRNSREIKM